MNVNLPESHTENQIKGNNIESSLYNPDRLINISMQANILAWVILAISIVFFVVATINFWVDFFSNTNYGYAPGIRDLIFYLASFFPALMGLFLYVILRFVAEGIFLFMDIEINFRELSERQK
jgi:hypothetical protein